MKAKNKYRLIEVKDCLGRYSNFTCLSSNDLNLLYHRLAKKADNLRNKGKCGGKVYGGCSYTTILCQATFEVREV